MIFTRYPIPIKYHANIVQLEQEKISDWVDLRAAERVNLTKGEYKRISLGVSMKLPRGFEAIIAPRSSTYERFGIIQANGIGVIDNSFNGEDDVWVFPAIALRDTNIPIYARICQFRIQRTQPKLFFYEGALNKKNRGGLGSTNHPNTQDQ